MAPGVDQSTQTLQVPTAAIVEKKARLDQLRHLCGCGNPNTPHQTPGLGDLGRWASIGNPATLRGVNVRDPRLHGSVPMPADPFRAANALILAAIPNATTHDRTQGTESNGSAGPVRRPIATHPRISTSRHDQCVFPKLTFAATESRPHRRARASERASERVRCGRSGCPAAGPSGRYALPRCSHRRTASGGRA